MQIRNKIFPYPVLNAFKDITSFKTSEYKLCYEGMIQTDDKVIFKDISIVLSNGELKRLLEEQKVKAVLIVECSRTLYRENFEIGIEPRDIEILLHNLKGNVEVSSYVYALEDIYNYRSNDFLEDYESYSFDIEKYNILAVDDGITIKIEYDEKKDKKVASIFSIIKDTNNEVKEMKIELLEKRIVIYLPEEQFNLYDNFKVNDNFTNMFFAMLAIPALVYALSTLKAEGLTLEEVEMTYSWFASVKRAYKKQYGMDLNEDAYRDMDIVRVSQALLNNGTILAIDDLFSLVVKNSMEEEDDE